MSRPDLPYTIVFNGEIYNYLEINADLETLGFQPRTRSDTETILLVYAAWGRNCVDRLNGMYSFVIRDDRRDVLFCARDRVGEKPFYFMHNGPFFAFASEVKAILQHPRVKREIDLNAAARYFMFEHVPAPYSIFKGIQQLRPGHRLEFDLSNGELSIDCSWDHMIDPVCDRKSLAGITDLPYWIERVRHVLHKSVARRLVSDVPVGVFLSGGLDSSAIAAVMCELRGGKNVQTFSMGFDEPSFDESPHSRRVAQFLETDHHEYRLTPKSMLESLPRVAALLDEPFADPSIFPCYHLARYTREHVTVALGGDGGDELFAGYSTFKALKWARIYNRFVPNFVDRFLVRPIAHCLPVSYRDFSFDFKVKQFLRGTKVREEERLWRWLGAFSSEELHTLLSREALMSLDLRGLYHEMRETWSKVMNCHPVVRDGYLYSKTYLSNQILVKLDRSTMASSLEARCPLLDPEMIELSDSIPGELKLRHGQLKYVLKTALHGKLPSEIISRPKKGFGMPVASWLRKELKDLAHDILSESSIRSGGILNPKAVQSLLDDHMAGRKDNRKPLWSLLMFEQWRRNWATGVSTPAGTNSIGSYRTPSAKAA